jgi:hypothetical protein
MRHPSEPPELAFPPRTEREAEVEAAVEAFASLVEGRTAVYVSSPITTGRFASEWRRGRGALAVAGVDDEFRRAVVEPNRRRAAEYVRELRKRERSVIDPAAVGDVPGWSQADYHVLWARVIERYARAVVFRDGWEHSSGCAYEFLVAHDTGARVLRDDLTPLSREEGRELLSVAAAENEAHGVPADFLKQVVDALDPGQVTAANP